jgi:hypothetical protein
MKYTRIVVNFLIVYLWVIGALAIIAINDPVVLPLMKVYIGLTIGFFTSSFFAKNETV